LVVEALPLSFSVRVVYVFVRRICPVHEPKVHGGLHLPR
jgi:hypothetical protein